jgi:hypothetical protein
MNAFNAFWSLDFRSFYLVNQAYMALLRMRRDAEDVKDFRPICLIYNISKLIIKTLSLKLAPHMQNLVRSNQTAFIKDHAIHDNLVAVQAMTKLLHARKQATILLKVDIVKAFDTMNWSFLLELLNHLGCSRRWTNWISTLLSTASTQILLNGYLGRRICHARGLRQGNPLSPMLFVLWMEALNAMFCLAADRSLFTPLRVSSIKHRISLYADDVMAFVSPNEQDIRLVMRLILESFADASGLDTNINKCQFTTIRCSSA